MPKKELSATMMKRLEEHSKDHGGKRHMNAMKKLMEEPPYPSMKKAHDMLMSKKGKKGMKAQSSKDRLDESEGKKKGMKKKKQDSQDRLDESEGKKKGKSMTPGQKKMAKVRAAKKY